MKKSTLLFINGILYLISGFILIIYPSGLVEYLGLPADENRFFQQILGSVFIGFSLGLFIQYIYSGIRSAGIGLYGAISVNTCGALMLIYKLFEGGLTLTVPGALSLGMLAGILLLISLITLIYNKNES